MTNGHVLKCVRLFMLWFALSTLRYSSPAALFPRKHLATQHDHRQAYFDRLEWSTAAALTRGFAKPTRFGPNPSPAKNRTYCRPTSVLQPHVCLILLCAGDVPLNPGPCPTCPRCCKPLYDSVVALQCDGCNIWVHRKCEQLSLPTYRRLSNCTEPWYCGVCQLPSFDDSLFEAPKQPALTTIASPTTAGDRPTAPGTTETRKTTSFWFSNLRSVKNKMLEFRVLTESRPNTIFALCETWLDNSIYDSQLVDLTRFKVYRKDRNRSGGGVLVAIPSSITCTRRHDLDRNDLEAIFVDLHSKRGLLHLCVAYCPPSKKTESYDLLQSSLSSVTLSKKKYSNVLVVGDFNAHINWSDLSSPKPTGPSDTVLLDHIETLGLTQVCSEPTYVTTNNHVSFLDLMFVSNPTLVSNCFTEPSLTGSDHKALTATTYHHLPKSGPHARRLHNFARLDTNHPNSLIHLAPWGMVLQDNHEDPYDIWLDFMHAIEAECVPSRKSRNKPRAPWITKEILLQARRKRQLFAQAKRNSCPFTLEAARTLQRNLKKQIRKSHQDYALDMAQRGVRDPKIFWAYVRRNKQNTSALNICQDGKALSDLETAELFSKHFAAAWTPPCSLSSQPETCPSSSQSASSPRLASILINEDDVKEALTRLSPSQSLGPDGIHPALLKASGQQLAPLLARLFQQLLDTGCVPAPWKQAYVTPIYKGNGSPADKPESYRPISTTSVVCRTMERVLNSALHRYLNAHTLLSPAQHGFRPNRSCETALLTPVHQISDSLDNSTPCELVQLDFTKAFDKVDHQLLITKLESTGIEGPLLRWLSNFILQRQQSVIDSATIMYADDLTLLQPIQSQEDYKQLQQDLDHIQAWTIRNKLPLSASKSATIHFTTKRKAQNPPVILTVNGTPLEQKENITLLDDLTLIQPLRTTDAYSGLQYTLDLCHRWSQVNGLPLNCAKSVCMTISHSVRSQSAPPVLTLGGSPIPRVSHTKLLGVTLDDKLDFHRHICDVASKARRTLGFVTHLSRDLPLEAFRNLYTALVLPQLEFCCAIWGPLQQSRQNALASIQRRAAFTFYRRSTPGSSLLSYRDVSTDSLLRNANWRLLQHRRDVASIRLFRRVMSADDMDCPNIPRLNRRSGRLQPVLARTLRHRRTCLLRAAELWLALPPELTAVIPKDRDSIKELCQLISWQDGWHL
ncbi:uncharacterized protein LOC115314129 [Ixodes scapularis]|uniref:uncharacterized protein LOC115314129 n=1 Tax=Ixodes scapularis TaxID=6945 RepID=UPI001A9E483A|nr:uncharacterized protein LOC115314129 [Ixodes scapularis]